MGGDKDGRGSLATSRERKTLLVDTELLTLPTGQAYLRLSGYPPARVTITPPRDMPIIAPDFLPVTRTIGEAVTTSASMPAPPPAQRIEDRDDWLSMGGA